MIADPRKIPTEQGSGVQGGAIAADLLTPARRRGTSQMLRRFLASTREIHDPEFWRPIIEALRIGARCATDVRGAASCASTLAALRAQDIRIAEEIDRQERLDRGDPTETVQHRIFAVEMDRRG